MKNDPDIPTPMPRRKPATLAPGYQKLAPKVKNPAEYFPQSDRPSYPTDVGHEIHLHIHTGGDLEKPANLSNAARIKRTSRKKSF